MHTSVAYTLESRKDKNYQNYEKMQIFLNYDVSNVGSYLPNIAIINFIQTDESFDIYAIVLPLCTVILKT